MAEGLYIVAVDSPGATAFKGTTYSMTGPPDFPLFSFPRIVYNRGGGRAAVGGEATTTVGGAS